jgi:type I restriction enzyme, S subunit
MKPAWPEVPLGSVITLQRGFDLPAEERRPGTVPIISSSGIFGTHCEAKARGPGVVTGRYGTIGRVFYVTEDYWPLNTTLWVKDFKGNDPRFVSYLLEVVDFAAYSDKSSVPGVNRNHLHQQRVRLPPLAEQQAISQLIGSFDDKISLNRRMNQTLEQIAQSLFKSWFVDFDPVRAKAEGRWKKGESLPGMPADMWDLWPSEFEETEIGENPKGWHVVGLPEAIEVNPPLRLAKGAEAPYVEMASLPTSSARVSGWVPRQFGSGTRFGNGDVLVARITPCLENGKTAFVDFLGDGQVGWGSTEFLVLRARPPLPPPYAYLLARTPEFRSHLIQNMSGTSGRQRAPADCLDSYGMVLPSADVAIRFGSTVGPWFDLMRTTDAEGDTLSHLRDALLPKLLSGEIRAQ